MYLEFTNISLRKGVLRLTQYLKKNTWNYFPHSSESRGNLKIWLLKMYNLVYYVIEKLSYKFDFK